MNVSKDQKIIEQMDKSYLCLCDKRMSKNLKSLICKVVVPLVALCGAVCWPFTKTRKHCDVMEMRILP